VLGANCQKSQDREPAGLTGMQCIEHTENRFAEKSRVEITADGFFDSLEK
jgi:hypothetical protein